MVVVTAAVLVEAAPERARVSRRRAHTRLLLDRERAVVLLGSDGVA